MTETADNRTPETWIYAGARISNRGKKMFAWQDPTGELLYFTKVSGLTVGGRYQFDVLRENGEFKSVFSGTKRYIGTDEDNAELVAGWQTEHRLAEARLARERAERKAASADDAFEQAMWPLRELRSKSCRTRADRTAFLAMVIDALGQ